MEIKIENGHRAQYASPGMLLTNGETFSKLVYLGDGAPEWEEVEDKGQLNGDIQNISEQ